jgi:uncharacterized protein YyaL (SSP411 family)
LKTKGKSGVHYNHLKNEKSPYLLQHAQNPVDWYPWGDEAFAKARLEDKPIFLSIGYSTCHWCHVMEHESFEDEQVARLLNDAFVNIKVDREERPDIDNIYMTVCQMMTQSGGWPLTIMMTQELKPFFAATYIPKESIYGRIGLLELIPQVKAIWAEKRDELINAAEEITKGLQEIHPQSTEKKLGEDTLKKAYEIFVRIFDREFGGFGNAPKFPSPHNLYFILRYWKRTGEAQALKMVEETLQSMRRGGIYDQIGFGFHRYSTDTKWIVPHFEKMLYDQALIAMACIETYQATGKAEYEKTAREIFTYVLRDMTDGQDGFYCAEDADSEGVEGKFYLWTEEEIRSVLKKDEADLFLSVFHHSDDAEVHGMQEMPACHFIPHLKKINDDKKSDLQKLAKIREKLFAVREKRIHPHKDDKILTDWNGLMIAALAKGAQVFDEPAYTQAASRAVEFILRRMRTTDGRLLHRFRDGVASIAAMVDDYAFIIWGLLELYEATFDAKYLEYALELNKELIIHFWDEKENGLFFTADDAEELLIRQKEIHDEAIPSGNSVSLANFLRLARITGDSSLENKAALISNVFSGRVGQMPNAFTQFLAAFDFALGSANEVIIAGDIDKNDTKDMLGVLRKSFVPNKIVILRPGGSASSEIEKIAPYTKSYQSIGGRATAYVCSNFTCQLPTSDPEKMMALLERGK